MTAVTTEPAEAPPPPTPRRPRSRKAQRRREAALAYVLVSPAFVVFGVFVFYPFIRNFKLALYQPGLFPGYPDRYVGFDNVRDVLESSDFRHSLWITIVYVVISVPAGIFLGLALAVAAHRRLRGIGIYRTIFASTVTSSVAVASVIFGVLFNSRTGYLRALGINPRPDVLENPDWALLGVAAVSIWQYIGLSFIVMSAGLQAIPDEVMEAAELDGARPWRRFWRVTVPMLSPTIFFAFVVGTIFSMQTFGQIDLLTPDGGPLDSTTTLVFSVFEHRNADPSYSAVLSIALFVLTLLITIAQMRLLERRVHYAG